MNIPPPITNQLTKPWPGWKKLLFRFSCIFLLTEILVVYNPVIILPGIGSYLAGWIGAIPSQSAVWVGQHVFHLKGVAAVPHPTDSRDEALDWISSAIVLAAAVLATLLWSLLDRRRKDYHVASLWLRYVLRLSLVFLMLRYGIGKIFPVQMNPPSLAVLNEPVGQTSPMTFFWTLMALNPRYEMLTGAIEVTAALLLLFRRTALSGALLNLFIIANVLCFNLFFDVPVKLGAILILLTTLAVIAPDTRRLYRFFWRHELSSPLDDRVPWELSKYRWFPRLLEAGLVCFTLYLLVPGTYGTVRAQHEAEQHPSPFVGEWLIKSGMPHASADAATQPAILGSPVDELYLEPDGLAMARTRDGRLWRAVVTINAARNTLALDSYLIDEKTLRGTYTFQHADQNHLVLIPMPDEAQTHSVLTLTKVPLPARYPLLDSGFHWVQEWAYER